MLDHIFHTTIIANCQQILPAYWLAMCRLVHFKWAQVGIIAGSRGDWVINREPKMTEILLRSC